VRASKLMKLQTDIRSVSYFLWRWHEIPNILYQTSYRITAIQHQQYSTWVAVQHAIPWITLNFLAFRQHLKRHIKSWN